MTSLDQRIAVTATHDLRQSHFTIPCGTPGEITETTGTSPTYYTVAFFPYGAGGANVIVDRLTRFDLRET